MQPAEKGTKKKLLLMLGAAGVILLVLAGLAASGVDVRALFGRGMALLRGAGPWAFFLAMALLPSLGMPMLTFTLTAGPLFEPQMGAGRVVAAALAALTFNLILSYSLARWVLRPWVTRVLERMGHRLPQLDSGDATDLIVVLRVVPGVPFFVQNYLLGLANAPMPRFLLISCAASWTYTTGIILFGHALLQGKGALAWGAAGVLIAAAAVTHFLRRHYQGRKKAA